MTPNRSSNAFSWLALACRLVLGGVFIYASIDKLLHPAAFAEAIFNYKILPTEMVNAVALTLPYLELFCGITVITGKWLFPASGILTVMLLVFIAALGFNLARGLDFQCGCFSTSQEAVSAGWTTLLRDLALVPVCAICLIKGAEDRLNLRGRRAV